MDSKRFQHTALNLALIALLGACAQNAAQQANSRAAAPMEYGRIANSPAEPVVAAMPAPPPAPAHVLSATAQGGVAAMREKQAAPKAEQRPQALVLNMQASASAYPPGNAVPGGDRETYQAIERNTVQRVAEHPVSTFSIDVDTGSYSNTRRLLNQGQLPRRDAVRVEELINYFPYDYPRPTGDKPFAVNTEISATPWSNDSLLLRIGIQAADPAKDTLPPANLVLLIDISGSMSAQAKLPLLKNALKLFIPQLRPQDRVSIVTYASGERIALPPTAADKQAEIIAAIDGLQAAGSTAGAQGIQMAYRMAEQAFIKDGINRILLATDGDFNVGITDFRQLKNLVEEKRRSGVSLSTLGFGVDNYNERLMEQLADAGDGAYSYIDTLKEGQKVLVSEFTSTLATVAHDVKVQMEFNPAQVAEYRLIGFENRALKQEDFSNDKVDAGEIGAGHRVTALYEITLAGSPGRLGNSRYAQASPKTGGNTSEELGFLRLRYKTEHGAASKEVATPIRREQITPLASQEMRFAAAVAAFGQRLADGGKYLGNFDYRQIRDLAQSGRGKDEFGYRGEFLQLLSLAEALSTKAKGQ